jgi:hypothetical protein
MKKRETTVMCIDFFRCRRGEMIDLLSMAVAAVHDQNVPVESHIQSRKMYCFIYKYTGPDWLIVRVNHDVSTHGPNKNLFGRKSRAPEDTNILRFIVNAKQTEVVCDIAR